MEILLLTLLGALTVGVGLWAASGERKDAGDSSGGSGGPGPRSSPGLPEAGAASGDADVGKPVVLGGGAPAGLEQLQDALQKIPSPVTGKVVPGEQEAGSPARPTGKRRPLEVTHSTDDLIARSSRHAHHRRALTNAETLVERQKGEEALAIYERVQQRIPDEEIRAKIQQNVEDIKRWLSGTDFTEEQSLKFPEIIIPLTTQAIAIENLSEGLRNISEGLVQQISSAFAALPLPPGSPGAGAPPGPGPATTPASPAAGPAPAAAPAGPPAPGAPAAGHAPAGPSDYEPGRGAPGPGASASTSGPAPVVPVGGVGPPPASLAPGGAFGIPAISGEIVSVGMGPDVADLTGTDQKSAFPPGFAFDGDGNLLTDGMSDADFDREWEKFKDLPLKDRRAGEERRKGIDRRRADDPRRRDRRSGDERRHRDLFDEREEFLKKLAEHKERKKQLQDFETKEKPEPKLRIPLHADLTAPKDAPQPAAMAEPERPQLPRLDLPGSEPLPESPREPAPAPPPATPAPLAPESDRTRTEIIGPDLHRVGMPQADEPFIGDAMRTRAAEGESGGGMPGSPAFSEGVEDAPEIPELEEESDQPKPPPQEIQGVLELKPPDEDDAPFLTLTYDFNKIPDSFKLSQDYHTMEFAYYKYKPMLIKAQQFTRRKMLKNALNYYRVIKSQNIPPEFKRMINRNIMDITEYLEKFLMRRN